VKRSGRSFWSTTTLQSAAFANDNDNDNDNDTENDMKDLNNIDGAKVHEGIEVTEGGCISLTGEGIAFMRLLSLRQALQLHPMKLSRHLPAATTMARKMLGIKGNRDKLLAQVEEIVARIQEERAIAAEVASGNLYWKNLKDSDTVEMTERYFLAIRDGKRLVINWSGQDSREAQLFLMGRAN